MVIIHFWNFSQQHTSLWCKASCLSLHSLTFTFFPKKESLIQSYYLHWMLTMSKKVELPLLFFKGAPYSGKASDMWALGVVLYTMLYGQFPFYDSIPHELFRKIKTAEFVLPKWVYFCGKFTYSQPHNVLEKDSFW